MRIRAIQPHANGILSVFSEDGRAGLFDITPYLQDEAFAYLRETAEFEKVVNGGYFVEWACGADLSADTIEARWQVVEVSVPRQTHLNSS